MPEKQKVVREPRPLASSGSGAPASDDGSLLAAAGASLAAQRRKELRTRRTLQVALLVVLLVSWQLWADLFDTAFWTSSPTDVLEQLFAWSETGTLWTGLRATLTATVVGFVIGASAGAVVGFLLGWMRTLGDVLEPFITALYTLPKIALAPLFVLWFGIGVTTKIAIAALLVFFLVFFTTFRGTREVDPELVDLARVMGAGRFATLLKIGMPSAGVWVFSGLKLALPYALIGAVVGEFIASTEGIGFLINNAAALLNTAGVFAGLVVLMITASGLTALLRLAEKHFLSWQDASN